MKCTNLHIFKLQTLLPIAGLPIRRRTPFFSFLRVGSRRDWPEGEKISCLTRKCRASSLSLSWPSPHSGHRIGPTALISSRKLAAISGWMRLVQEIQMSNLTGGHYCAERGCCITFQLNVHVAYWYRTKLDIDKNTTKVEHDKTHS